MLGELDDFSQVCLKFAVSAIPYHGEALDLEVRWLAKSWRDWALDTLQQYLLSALALYGHVQVLDHFEATAPQGC